MTSNWYDLYVCKQTADHWMWVNLELWWIWIFFLVAFTPGTLQFKMNICICVWTALFALTHISLMMDTKTKISKNKRLIKWESRGGGTCIWSVLQWRTRKKAALRLLDLCVQVWLLLPGQTYQCCWFWILARLWSHWGQSSASPVLVFSPRPPLGSDPGPHTGNHKRSLINPGVKASTMTWKLVIFHFF